MPLLLSGRVFFLTCRICGTCLQGLIKVSLFIQIIQIRSANIYHNWWSVKCFFVSEQKKFSAMRPGVSFLSRAVCLRSSGTDTAGILCCSVCNQRGSPESCRVRLLPTELWDAWFVWKNQAFSLKNLANPKQLPGLKCKKTLRLPIL